MKKKLIVTFMAFSLSVMMFGCGTDTETGKDANSTTKVEGTTKPTEAPTSTTKPTEAPTPTTKPTETPTPTPEVTISFEDAVKGKYLVTEDGQEGYYFGEEKVIQAGIDFGQEEYDYYMDSEGNITIIGMPVLWEFKDGKIWIGSGWSSVELVPFKEVDKEEFDNLFGNEFSFEADIVGKYWVEAWYGGSHGYYFDTDKVIIGNSEGQRECSYYLEEDSWVNIDGCSYLYDFWNGQLSLATPPEEGFSYKEVDKAEFDNLFKSTIEGTNSEAQNNFKDNVEGKYWVYKWTDGEDYGVYGVYFDGEFMSQVSTSNGTFDYYITDEYFFEDSFIVVIDDYYHYRIVDGKLGFCFIDSEDFPWYYEEVDKNTFDNLFFS